MKIQILSDLHNEFGLAEGLRTDADIVVLAGDVHVREKSVLWAAQTFAGQRVVQIAGNHEYYGGSLGKTKSKMQQLAKDAGIDLLDDSQVIIAGIRFLGCTLWTDYRLTGNRQMAMIDAKSQMNDYVKIRDAQYRKVKPNQLAEAHSKSVAFLEEALEQTHNGPTVVVTHHAPSEQSLAQEYRLSADPLNSCYASNLEHLVAKADLWIHGHTHDSADYQIGSCRVICNPRGYAPANLNPNFNPSLIIEQT